MRILYTTAILLFVMLGAMNLNAQDGQNKVIMDLVRMNAPRLQLTPQDVDNSIISSSYVDEKTNIRYVYLQQGVNGVKVFNTLKTILFRDNEVLYSSGKFVQGIQEKAGSALPSVQPELAIQQAAAHLKLASPVGLRITQDAFAESKKYRFSAANIARQEIETELFYVVSDDLKEVRLAWNVNIDVLGSSDWWNVRIDARNGEMIEKDNWTVHEKPHAEHEHKATVATKRFEPEVAEAGTHLPFNPPTVTSGSYRVIPFPNESPLHANPAIENNPWLKAGAVNNATTHGWHFDGANNYITTRGNNVHAYLDVAATNNPTGTGNNADTSTTADPSLTFGSTADFNSEPSVLANRRAAVTNLFYWNNIIHDVLYQYGFNERSGNFQTDNMGRGGLGNDYVQAEAQDGGGTNNANFATPADGSRPRMQMYLWSAVPGVIVNTPASIAGKYQAIEGNYSTANLLANTGPVTGGVVYYNDGGGTHEACVPPTNALAGKIVLIDRGNCNFTVKIKNAQDAGAIGVIMINNVPGSPIIMGGTDNTITIPSMMVSDVVGASLLAQLGNNLNVTLSPGVKLDGDFDNGVVVHEFGHGVSNRLTGGPANASCLSNAEQGGEGWSDYLGLMLTTKWNTQTLTGGSSPRHIGQFVIGEPLSGVGIRSRPYSTNMNVNNLTYADMAVNPQVHFIGEIWCATLWDMTWNIIQQVGSISPDIYNTSSTGGNVIAMRLVMEGMRLQPCRPGYLDARDAILAADSILYNGAYKCAIWKAFARRGMGFSAQQGLSTSATDQVVAFDVPSLVTMKKATVPVIITSGNQTTITLQATCQCAVPANNYTIRDTIPAGFSFVSATGGGTLSGNVVNFSGISFTQANETKTFTVTLQANGAGCNVDTTLNDNREGSTVGGFTPVTSSGSGNWAVSTVRSKSGNSSWWATGFPGSSEYSVNSSPFTVGSLSIVSFWHYYFAENALDGGRVELSTDGTNWIDAGPYIVQNGYNLTMAPASPWGGGSRSFSGSSYGQGNGNFINTVLNLSPFSGQQVRLRFNVKTSASNIGTFEGWYVDDILGMNGCGGLVKAGLYDAANNKIDSSAVPVFVRQNANSPASITTQPANVTSCANGTASFSVTAASAQPMTYQWQISTNGGTSFTDIAGATTSTYTINPVTAAMAGHQFRVVINNGFGATTSNAATLTLGSGPAAATINNATGCVGQSASFSATAVANVTYQWQVSTDGGVNFSNISGATSNTLQVQNLTAAQNNNRYRLVMTNSCGSANSNAAILSVNNASPVTIQPLPASLCTTDPAVALVATVSGGTWTGSGVSGSTFNPSGLSAGSYTINYTVTNANGCISNASASINVTACANTLLPIDADGAITLHLEPSTGRYYIKFNTALYTQLGLNIFASDAKLVYSGAITNITLGKIVPVNTINLASDMYVLSLYDTATGKKVTFRILVGR